jgi:glycosyltransferase involved in cell wall biosynthesis
MSVEVHRRKIVIVMPVFEDWEAFAQVIAQLGQQNDLRPYNVSVLAVDDGSSKKLTDTDTLMATKGMLKNVRIIHLACNLGHQRAIAVGIVEASKADDVDAVVVMDSDGEDDPGAVPRLIAAWDKHDHSSIVLAKRGRRSETLLFTLFYSLYRLGFRIMTGQSISFGNFSLLPRPALQALIHNPAIWNNLAAAIARSRIPCTSLQIDRSTRLAGKSRMNFLSLTIHGLSAISVYTDVVLVRMILMSLMLAGIVLLGLIAVIAIRFGTELAIPGWASYVAASLTIIFIQAIILAGIALFLLLSFRSLKPFIPASDASAFVIE